MHVYKQIFVKREREIKMPKAPIDEGLGKTLDMYRNVAIVINSYPKGEKISVQDLAEKAKVHWNTAKKALIFFHKIAPLVPKFEMVEDLRFRVKEKPSAMDAVEGIFESQEMRILTKMMLLGIVDIEKASKLNAHLKPEERSYLANLIEKGYVNSINGNYYLSKRGQSIGSMGLRRIVNLNIPLPWETGSQSVETKIKHPLHLKKSIYKSPTLNAPKPIFKHSFPKSEIPRFYT